MSIINDALKKLQNQIGHSYPPPQEGANSTEPAPLTSAQQAGFEPISPLHSSPASAAPHKKEIKVADSRLVLILVLLCLLTGLFVPFVNKQSLLTMLLAKMPQRSKTIDFQATSVQPKATAPTPIATPAPAPVAAAASEGEPKAQPIQQFVKNLTAPASRLQTNNASRIIVNGIMTQGDKNVALIDGQIYEEGEEVDGVKILKITPKGVTVLENGVERSVKVMGL